MPQLGFSLTLTVCELRAIFLVSSQYVYNFDCFPAMIHTISKKASTRPNTFFSELTTAEYMAKMWQ